MANTTKFLRKLADVVSTKEDKGLELNIKVAAYDNGGILVNGKYFTCDSPAEAALCASAQITGMLGILFEQLAKRQAAKTKSVGGKLA